jgi:predicted DNA-binding transcriptional regulator AlpA
MRPLAYRIGVAAQMIGISKSKMYELVNKGAIRTRKIEGATIVLRSDLEAFLAALPVASYGNGVIGQLDALRAVRH